MRLRKCGDMLYVKRKGKENATHCEAEIISHVDNEQEAGRLRNKGGTRGQHRSLGVSKAVLSHSRGPGRRTHSPDRVCLRVI